jgi:hypothetical protein
MKKALTLLSGLLPALLLLGQSFEITWSDEKSLKTSSDGFDAVASDNTGLYFVDREYKMNRLGGTDISAHKLLKYDQYFNELYTRDYKKELRGMGFYGFRMVASELYLFATDYSKKDRAFKLYAARIDKNNGDPVGDFVEVGSYEVKDKYDQNEGRTLPLRMTQVNNGNDFLLIRDVSFEDRQALAVSVLDKNLQIKETTTIQLPFAKNHHNLFDVQLIPGNKVVLLIKEYHDVPVIDKKEKERVFKNFVLWVYNLKGKKEKDIPLRNTDRFITSAKLIEQPGGGLLLAAFYSDVSKKDELAGFFINKLNIDSGTMTVVSNKEINPDMLVKSFTDNSDDIDDDIDGRESKSLAQQIRANGTLKEYPNETLFRNVFINPSDNSINIIAEQSVYNLTSYTKVRGRGLSDEKIFLHTYKQKDALVINADKNGNIRWVNTIPKAQEEENPSYFLATSYFVDFDRAGYFTKISQPPFYASFFSYMKNNTLTILMNDHADNKVNAKPGELIKTITNFRNKSNIYAIKVDLATGKMDRELVAANTPKTVLPLRHLFPINEDLFYPDINTTKATVEKARIVLKIAKISAK